MSGPIVRKYGFPNFEAIFGQRDIQHGTEEGGKGQPGSPPPPPDPNRTPDDDPDSPPGAGATEEQKESEDSAQL